MTAAKEYGLICTTAAAESIFDGRTIPVGMKGRSSKPGLTGAAWPSSPSHRKPPIATATSCKASSPGTSTRSSRPELDRCCDSERDEASPVGVRWI